MIIEQNISLLPFNTFGIDCTASHFVSINDISNLADLVRTKEFKVKRRLVLGGGSNLLFTNDFDGLVIKNQLKGINIIDENDEFVWINVMGGENWHQLVTRCVEEGWGGIENLALIPGCVGAAPIQNIGAYGVEIKDVFISLEAFMWDSGDVQVFFNEDCKFGYRDSIFKREMKNKAMVISVTLKLSRMPSVNVSYGAIGDVLQDRGVTNIKIEDVYNAVIDIRHSKLPDPAEIGNAGSFFKNPELPTEKAHAILKEHPGAPHYVINDDVIKIPAGWLIEQCGWKGYKEDSIGVHDHQALVLVNFGEGSGHAIMELAMKIKASVYEKFGVELHTEVNIID